MAFRSDRIAVATVFAVHGAVQGTFATRIPAIAEHLHLSSGSLGLALLMPGIGALALMSVTGRVIHTLGGRAATRLLLAMWCLALILPALAPNLPVLCVLLLIFGACAGMADVAMNAQGVALEQRVGKSIISSLHGLWSIGGFVAAGIGALAAAANLGVIVHFGVMAAVLLIVGLIASHRLPSAPPGEVSEGGAEAKPPRFAFPTGVVLIIALVAFCAVFCEISGSDWSAVYLRRVLGSGHATAALGFTVYAAGMATCRLVGDQVIRRLGPVRTVRFSAAIGTIGAALIVWAANTALTIVGFGLMGVGVAVVVPLAFAAAGRVGAAGGGAQTGHAIAGVATIAYGAGLAAPGAIGGIASFTSLRASFVVVIVCAATVALSARVLRVRQTDPPIGAATAQTDPGVPTVAM